MEASNNIISTLIPVRFWTRHLSVGSWKTLPQHQPLVNASSSSGFWKIHWSVYERLSSKKGKIFDLNVDMIHLNMMDGWIYIYRCVEDVLAPACFRDKVNVRPVALQGQFTEVGFGGRRQVRALWRNRDTASRAQQLLVSPCQWSVHMTTQPSLSRSVWGRKSSSFQGKLEHDRSWIV